MTPERPDKENLKYRLWRQDEYGNQFPMNITGTQRFTLEQLDLFQNRGHGQLYFLKEEPVKNSYLEFIQDSLELKLLFEVAPAS